MKWSSENNCTTTTRSFSSSDRVSFNGIDNAVKQEALVGANEEPGFGRPRTAPYKILSIRGLGTNNSLHEAYCVVHTIHTRTMKTRESLVAFAGCLSSFSHACWNFRQQWCSYRNEWVRSKLASGSVDAKGREESALSVSHINHCVILVMIAW